MQLHLLPMRHPPASADCYGLLRKFAQDDDRTRSARAAAAAAPPASPRPPAPAALTWQPPPPQARRRRARAQPRGVPSQCPPPPARGANCISGGLAPCHHAPTKVAFPLLLMPWPTHRRLISQRGQQNSCCRLVVSQERTVRPLTTSQCNTAGTFDAFSCLRQTSRTNYLARITLHIHVLRGLIEHVSMSRWCDARVPAWPGTWPIGRHPQGLARARGASGGGRHCLSAGAGGTRCGWSACGRAPAGPVQATILGS